MAFTSLFASSATVSAATADDNTTEPQGEEVLNTCDKLPEFKGSMMQWLYQNLKYPEEAVKNNIEGRVIVRFVVGKNGKIYNPEVVRSIHPALDAEAVRVIKAMPEWTPGLKDGKAVNVKYTIPVSFKLQGKEQPKK